jgi:hypothetical protein
MSFITVANDDTVLLYELARRMRIHPNEMQEKIGDNIRVDFKLAEYFMAKFNTHPDTIRQVKKDFDDAIADKRERLRLEINRKNAEFLKLHPLPEPSFRRLDDVVVTIRATQSELDDFEKWKSGLHSPITEDICPKLCEDNRSKYDKIINECVEIGCNYDETLKAIMALNHGTVSPKIISDRIKLAIQSIKE